MGLDEIEENSFIYYKFMATLEQAKEILQTVNRLPRLSEQLRSTSDDLFSTFTKTPVTDTMKQWLSDIIRLINEKKTKITEWDRSYKSILTNIQESNAKSRDSSLNPKVQQEAQKSLESYRKQLSGLDREFQTIWVGHEYDSTVWWVETPTDVENTLNDLDTVQENYQEFHKFMNSCQLSNDPITEEVYIWKTDKYLEMQDKLFSYMASWMVYAYELKGYWTDDIITLDDIEYDGQRYESITIEWITFDAATGRVTVSNNIKIKASGKDITNTDLPIPLTISGSVTIAWQTVQHEKKLNITLKEYANTKESKIPRIFRKKEKKNQETWEKKSWKERMKWMWEKILNPFRTTKKITAGTSHELWWVLWLWVAPVLATTSAANHIWWSVLQAGIKDVVDDAVERHNASKWWRYAPKMVTQLPGFAIKNVVNILTSPFRWAGRAFSRIWSSTNEYVRWVTERTKSGDFAVLDTIKSNAWVVRNMYERYDILPTEVRKLAA